MTFIAKATCAVCAFVSFTYALAQSGTPALMTPMANPDPRLAAIHARSSGLHAPGSVAISPDGQLVAYTVRERTGSILHITSATGQDAAKDEIVAPGISAQSGGAACSNGAPVWSPNSQTLAYTSSCAYKDDKSAQDQIFTYDRSTGASKQLSHLNGLFQQVSFSPTGDLIAFLFVENATRAAGALAAMKPWAGVVGEDGVEVQRVYAIDADGSGGGTGMFLTPANLHVYEFNWSPVGKEIAYVAANPPGENNWWVAKLYTQTNKAEPKVVFDPNTTRSALHGLQIAVPRYSPDGKQIAFIGGLMSDQGSTGGDVWTVASTGGGEPSDITPGIDGTPTFINWTGPDNIGFVEERRGHELLTDYVVSTRTQDAQQDLGEVYIGGGPIKNAIGVSNNGVLAYVESGHATAPEVYAGPFNGQAPITHLNDGIKSSAHVESVEWTNEGMNVQGWLTYPVDYDAKKKYPLMVIVHGGPSASAGAGFANPVWSELGYFVFAPNPRGSFGQGEKFTAANRKDFGYGDLRDITSGMDAIEKKVSIDTKREGLMGWSYGGFMTMFAVTQTHRFRAAVAGAGIANWLSYYGENSIDQWMVPFFGATVYDDPAVYAKSSAIDYIKNVTTPTLVVVGDRDGECPAPQSFEFWHALRAQGVKTQLVVFPNEGHGFRDPGHIRDLEARQVSWFAENMPTK